MMFRTRRFDASSAHRQVYSLYEIAYTLVDFSAAVLFIIGSILFFYKSMQDAGTWMFLIGSIFFALRPTVRLFREIHLAVLSHEGLLDQEE